MQHGANGRGPCRLSGPCLPFADAPAPPDTHQAEPETLSIKRSLGSGTSILLTGSLGFIGSLVLEQVLRCCPDIERIYVLARGKRHLGPEHRLRRRALPRQAAHCLWPLRTAWALMTCMHVDARMHGGE